MAYAENKKKIDNIRQEYGCKGEMIFRAALTLIVEVGQCAILDEAWYQCELDNIDEKHDAAEKVGKTLFITRDFEKAILECARELAQINAYDLLAYIQKEVWLGGDGISYKRAIELLKGCLDYCATYVAETLEAKEEAEIIGFTDDEIEDLGYGYLLDVVEEE